MNIFERLARKYVRHQVKRRYQAAQQSHLRKKISEEGQGPNAVMDHARGKLRAYARHLDENHDIATGIFNTLVDKTVGHGIEIEPLIKKTNGSLADEVNKQIQQLLDNVLDNLDATGMLPWSEYQALQVRAMYRDGEVLLNDVYKRIDDKNPLPFYVQAIDADLMPFQLNEKNPSIIHGVGVTQFLRPTNYYLWKNHPDDKLLSGFTARVEDTTPVDANLITHLKFTRRLNQVRGVPIIHSVIHRLHDISDYDESERIAAKIGASFSAYIQKSDNFGLPDDPDSQDNQTGKRHMEMEAGMIFDDLKPGETVGTIDAKRPNTEYGNFKNSNLRSAAAGVGTSYSSIAKDYNGTYSAQRQELVEAEPGYQRMREFYIRKVLKPTYRKIIDIALLTGALRFPQRGIDIATLYDAVYIPPGMPWIDVLKEVQADSEKIAARIASRHQVIRQRGGDPREVDELIKSDPFNEEIYATEKPGAGGKTDGQNDNSKDDDQGDDEK